MEVKKFWTRRQGLIMVWPGEEPLRFKYNGRLFVVPSRFETAIPEKPGSVYNRPSARAGNGEYIRGTCVVEDETVQLGGGGTKDVLRVNDLATFLTRDREDLFEQGFNIVTEVSDVTTAMEMGIPRWDNSQEVRARGLISAELERLARYQAKGTPAPPPPWPHLLQWATSHLKKRALTQPQFNQDELRSILEGRMVQEKSPATVPVETPKTAMGLYDEAKLLGIQLTKLEMQGVLDNDEEQLRFIREKIKARRERNVEEQSMRIEGATA